MNAGGGIERGGLEGLVVFGEWNLPQVAVYLA